MKLKLRDFPSDWPVLFSVAALLLLAAGCSGAATPTAPPPTPSLVPTLAPATATPLPAITLLDQELLGSEGITTACDAPEAAGLTCHDEAAELRLEVDIAASTYARWRMQWTNAHQPLQGDETLMLDVDLAGNLSPNLYLVEADGRRTGVSLDRFDLQTGQHTVHIPLREVRDGEGNIPNFAAVNEIQIVFEWADMQGSLTVEGVRFASVWREAVDVDTTAHELAAGLQTPRGFQVEAMANDLREMTQIAFTPAGDMLVSRQKGRIWWYSDDDGDGYYDQRHLFATGFPEVVGLLFHPLEKGVWVGGRGQLVYVQDTDGNGAADHREVRLEGLPWGRHQNNGLVWNPEPDPFSGEPAYTWIYFGLGSTEDLAVGGEYNATILRFPAQGQGVADLEIVSRGNRNSYDLVWAALPVDQETRRPEAEITDTGTVERAWQLFASENGPDFNDAPDEVNHIRWGKHYGFPEHFGPLEDPEAENDPYSGPVYPVTPHASADGMAYIDNETWPEAYRTLYVSLFGEVFSPEPAGHIVERISLQQVTLPDGEVTYRGEPSDFVTGLDRPLPLTTGPAGNLWVGDYATGVVYRVRYAAEGETE